ncbi:unnamed protein product [Ranitomeya imitator]|uniref:Uncharacterized protein n=1 Tax=Ranitomeya imitator TaxID=111125 RepID=A0ABN9L0U8_9NEOB|nr:unnamed protein product [Ranitomeya imitator]
MKTRRGRHGMKIGGAGADLRHPFDRTAAGTPLGEYNLTSFSPFSGYIGGLTTAFQKAVDKPLMTRSDFAPFCSFFSFYIDFVLVSRFPDLRSVVRSPLPPVSAQPMFCDHKSAGGRCRCAAGLMAGSVFSVGLCTCEGLRMSPPCARRCRFCTGGKYLGIPVLARSAACPGHKDDEEHGGEEDGGGGSARSNASRSTRGFGFQTQADAHSWSLFMEVSNQKIDV